MLKIEVSIDGAQFDRTADGYMRERLQPALVEAVNLAARAAQERVRAEMERVFEGGANPFTLQGVQVFEARLGGDREPAALVSIKPQQAEYLQFAVFGGTRTAGDYATTRAGPLVPGPAAPRDRFGNLPRGFVQQALQDPQVAWVHLSPDKPPALVRRTENGLEVLALIVEETSYTTPRLEFHDAVATAVRDTLQDAFAAALGA